LSISKFRNVIVGDNGAGKTALLEAIFMALGASSEMVLRFRQFRGLDGAFRGPSRKIEEALWRDYFYNFDMSRSISVVLTGNGPEARSVRIDRGQGEVFLPLQQALPSSTSSSVRFQWQDHTGKFWSAVPEISTTGIKFQETGEDLPDFFFVASNQTYSSAENADRFSDLSRNKRRKFIDVFTNEYDWIEDLTIESKVGSPAIYGTLKGLSDQIPITAISGGLNRIMTILLMMASRERSVILVDELENGLYYSHHRAYWKAVLAFSREYNSQLFLTTHSEEWLEALAAVMDAKTDDIALWRAERVNGIPTIRQFFGKQVPVGIRSGEVR
jgi:predicted ATPase